MWYPSSYKGQQRSSESKSFTESLGYYAAGLLTTIAWFVMLILLALVF